MINDLEQVMETKSERNTSYHRTYQKQKKNISRDLIKAEFKITKKPKIIKDKPIKNNNYDEKKIIMNIGEMIEKMGYIKSYKKLQKQTKKLGIFKQSFLKNTQIDNNNNHQQFISQVDLKKQKILEVIQNSNNNSLSLMFQKIERILQQDSQNLEKNMFSKEKKQQIDKNSKQQKYSQMPKIAQIYNKYINYENRMKYILPVHKILSISLSSKIQYLALSQNRQYFIICDSKYNLKVIKNRQIQHEQNYQKYGTICAIKWIKSHLILGVTKKGYVILWNCSLQFIIKANIRKNIKQCIVQIDSARSQNHLISISAITGNQTLYKVTLVYEIAGKIKIINEEEINLTLSYYKLFQYRLYKDNEMQNPTINNFMNDFWQKIQKNVQEEILIGLCQKRKSIILIDPLVKEQGIIYEVSNKSKIDCLKIDKKYQQIFIVVSTRQQNVLGNIEIIFKICRLNLYGKLQQEYPIKFKQYSHKNNGKNIYINEKRVKDIRFIHDRSIAVIIMKKKIVYYSLKSKTILNYFQTDDEEAGLTNNFCLTNEDQQLLLVRGHIMLTYSTQNKILETIKVPKKKLESHFQNLLIGSTREELNAFIRNYTDNPGLMATLAQI